MGNNLINNLKHMREIQSHMWIIEWDMRMNTEYRKWKYYHI